MKVAIDATYNPWGGSLSQLIQIIKYMTDIDNQVDVVVGAYCDIGLSRDAGWDEGIGIYAITRPLVGGYAPGRICRYHVDGI